ncbi:hypothetical protein HYPSUDRAFT_207058 [Hypholoma sublateritium FD-334 SS-4]|uniref:Uncharacterized protein n=1 Tax=Hypholoma sublateritium (strain FD-334 SS-4) TaxID=945553 RepID=A0A0D2NBD1_HYPSF|nr:hypothetical protein HYPSUDRAFT_207058 [Hypholoma sublateritium FD-334 SS-4]
MTRFLTLAPSRHTPQSILHVLYTDDLERVVPDTRAGPRTFDAGLPSVATHRQVLRPKRRVHIVLQPIHTNTRRLHTLAHTQSPSKNEHLGLILHGIVEQLHAHVRSPFQRVSASDPKTPRSPVLTRTLRLPASSPPSISTSSPALSSSPTSPGLPRVSTPDCRRAARRRTPDILFSFLSMPARTITRNGESDEGSAATKFVWFRCHKDGSELRRATLGRRSTPCNEGDLMRIGCGDTELPGEIARRLRRYCQSDGLAVEAGPNKFRAIG